MNGWPYFETFSRTYVRPELTHSILKVNTYVHACINNVHCTCTCTMYVHCIKYTCTVYSVHVCVCGHGFFLLQLLKLSLSTPRDAFTAVCKFTHACFQVKWYTCTCTCTYYTCTYTCIYMYMCIHPTHAAQCLLCIQPDYRRRPTARHLLDHELLTNHYSVCHNPCVHGHL